MLGMFIGGFDMKLTEEQIKEIRKLRKEGMLLRQIAGKFKVTSSTIRYYISEKERERVNKTARDCWKNLSNEKKKEIYLKRKKYMKEYQRNKYKNDEVWREKQKKRTREYYKNKNDKNKK